MLHVFCPVLYFLIVREKVQNKTLSHDSPILLVNKNTYEILLFLVLSGHCNFSIPPKPSGISENLTKTEKGPPAFLRPAVTGLIQFFKVSEQDSTKMLLKFAGRFLWCGRLLTRDLVLGELNQNTVGKSALACLSGGNALRRIAIYGFPLPNCWI